MRQTDIQKLEKLHTDITKLRISKNMYWNLEEGVRGNNDIGEYQDVKIWIRQDLFSLGGENF